MLEQHFLIWSIIAQGHLLPLMTSHSSLNQIITWMDYFLCARLRSEPFTRVNSLITHFTVEKSEAQLLLNGGSKTSGGQLAL